MVWELALLLVLALLTLMLVRAVSPQENAKSKWKKTMKKLKKRKALCDGIVCYNGGKCVAGKCECHPDWTGRFCQERIPCTLNGKVCMGHRGECVNGQCVCGEMFPDGVSYTGKYCEQCPGVTCPPGYYCASRQYPNSPYAYCRPNDDSNPGFKVRTNDF